MTAAGVVVIALRVRQLLAVLDNRRLLRQLQRAQLELRHQAFHDPLTGLANRALSPTACATTPTATKPATPFLQPSRNGCGR